jgi:hypothetical protein
MTAPAVAPNPQISRTELAVRIMRLPPAQQAVAIAHLRAIQKRSEKKGARSQATRDVAHRRKYAGDPWAYVSDILGWHLSQQEEDVLDRLMTAPRVLIPSGNNLGKTFILGCYGIYRFDAVAALEDAETGEREQGARILLPGPDHDTIFQTIYAEILTHARRAESRGHLMPGSRSEKSVMWEVRPKWNMEAFSPPARVTEQVAHKASGRHHRNQVALIEEGQGVPEPTWKAVEGMCSAEGNQIISSFNPTEPVGSAYARSKTGTYSTIHLSAMEHPNVLERRPVIPAAIDFLVIDGRVRDQCQERGAFPGTNLEPEHHDFVYALPPIGAKEYSGESPRADGVPGHPTAAKKVYRPSAAFTAQVLGQWPASAEASLFSAGSWDAAVARWRARPAPASAPDCVGVDVAREGKDDTIAAPRWGDAADVLLRAYFIAEQQGEAAIKKLLLIRRIYSGALAMIMKGDGSQVANQLHRKFPSSPFSVDEGGIGSSPFDYLRRVLRRDAIGVMFAAKALPPVNDAEPWSVNLRTQLYVRAAMLANRGLVDVPDSPRLREEVLAHSVSPAPLTVERTDRRTGEIKKERVEAVALIDKKEVKKLIGRSPDESDAWVLSLFSRPYSAPVPMFSTFRVR